MNGIEIINYCPFSSIDRVLNVKYRFRNMPYLAADKYGNFFILTHCPNKRTIPFKQIDKSKGYIYYHGNKIRLSTLRTRVIKSVEKLAI